MINRLHARSHRPEAGWDPVPKAHAASYGALEWERFDAGVLDTLEHAIGGFAGLRILDLGGGPAQYSVGMAQRGGLVTWHDVSRGYLEMGQAKALQHGVADRVRFSLGYLDEAPSRLSEPFDLVFNRICWNYGFADASFAKIVYALVRPGGWAYVDTTHSGFKRDTLSASARLRTWLNDTIGVKVGHPFPPHGRLARLFTAMPTQWMSIDYRSPDNDRILFQKVAAR